MSPMYILTLIFVLFKKNTPSKKETLSESKVKELIYESILCFGVGVSLPSLYVPHSTFILIFYHIRTLICVHTMIDTPTSLHVAWCVSVLWCCDVNGALSEKCTVICGVCFVLLLHASVCVCMCVCPRIKCVWQ